MKGINLHGMVSFGHAVLRTPTLLVPHLSVKDLNEIPFAELHAMGFKGIVFDKDNTLTTPYAREIVPRIEDALRTSQRVFGHDRVVIFSNSAGSTDDAPHFQQAADMEQALDVRVLRHGVKKPQGVDEIQRDLDIPLHELVMIGDRYSTDILFGNSNGMFTIRTEQLSLEHESSLNLAMQRIEKTIYERLVALGYEPPHHPLYQKSK
ncbi:unnamed protein product [Aphanomyces euteiches]|nr:hypothetical protein Ae201684P_001626 [Aphanomyces euteiches]